MLLKEIKNTDEISAIVKQEINRNNCFVLHLINHGEVDYRWNLDDAREFIETCFDDE